VVSSPIIKASGISVLLAFLSLPAFATDKSVAPVEVVKPAAMAGNADKGNAVFRANCAMCHSLIQNKVGPRLGGVAGRKAGILPDYSYSLGLKNLGLVWDDANLDRWLAGPASVVADTKMPLKLVSAQDRADVIAYLKAAR
jgi:cytochrome c